MGQGAAEVWGVAEEVAVVGGGEGGGTDLHLSRWEGGMDGGMMEATRLGRRDWFKSGLSNYPPLRSTPFDNLPWTLAVGWYKLDHSRYT